mmetsp:Transcript_77837/g.241210  ORF Transcript_77837/g.241210 Transcript_77837/m.241210 type:complete len:205 (-) Transcript_77837:653-1267(-)
MPCRLPPRGLPSSPSNGAGSGWPNRTRPSPRPRRRSPTGRHRPTSNPPRRWGCQTRRRRPAAWPPRAMVPQRRHHRQCHAASPPPRPKACTGRSCVGGCLSNACRARPPCGLCHRQTLRGCRAASRRRRAPRVGANVRSWPARAAPCLLLPRSPRSPSPCPSRAAARPCPHRARRGCQSASRWPTPQAQAGVQIQGLAARPATF